MPVGSWSQVTIIKSLDAVKVSKDGEVISSVDWRGEICPTTSGSILVGARKSERSSRLENYFVGIIDDISIISDTWIPSKLLPSGHVQSASGEPGLLRHFRCDEGLGHMLTDEVSSGLAFVRSEWDAYDVDLWELSGAKIDDVIIVESGGPSLFVLNGTYQYSHSLEVEVTKWPTEGTIHRALLLTDMTNSMGFSFETAQLDSSMSIFIGEKLVFVPHNHIIGEMIDTLKYRVRASNGVLSTNEVDLRIFISVTNRLPRVGLSENRHLALSFHDVSVVDADSTKSKWASSALFASFQVSSNNNASNLILNNLGEELVFQHGHIHRPDSITSAQSLQFYSSAESLNAIIENITLVTTSERVPSDTLLKINVTDEILAWNSSLPLSNSLTIGLRYRMGAIPYIEYIFPFTAPSSGGSFVNIRGRNFGVFDRNLVCVFGTMNIKSTAQRIANDRLKCIIPPHPLMHTFLFVEDDVGFVSNRVQFSFVQQPALHSLHPNSGRLDGGTVVRVRGERFMKTPFVHCRFGELAFVIATYISKAEIECTTPPFNSIGLVDLAITYNGVHISESILPFTVEIGPEIFSIFPSFGYHGGNRLVVVTGSNFQNSSNVQCRFGTYVVDAFNVSQSQVNCEAPGLSYTSKSAVPVSVSTNGCADWTSSDIFYEYVEAPIVYDISPKMGPIGSNTLVIISGKFWFTSFNALTSFF